MDSDSESKQSVSILPYEELRKDVFSDDGYYSKQIKSYAFDSKNVFVIIGSSVEKNRIKESIKLAKQKNSDCKLVIFCVNKDSICSNIASQVERMYALMVAAKNVKNKAIKFCFLVDEDGLDTRAYPLLQLLCDELEPRRGRISLISTLGKRESVGVHETCVFAFMDQAQYTADKLPRERGRIHYTGTIEGRGTCVEHYLIELTNKHMPYGVWLKNILFSKSFTVILLLGAYMMHQKYFLDAA